MVPLQMILVEVLEEEAAHILAQGVLDERQILVERLLSKGGLQELVKPRHDVIGKPVLVQDGQHVVLVWSEGRLRNLLQIVRQCFPLVRQHQPRLVQRIPPKHTADGVGEETANISIQLSSMNSYILLIHIRCEFIF